MVTKDNSLIDYTLTGHSNLGYIYTQDYMYQYLLIPFL